jgi:hypothetical protein
MKDGHSHRQSAGLQRLTWLCTTSARIRLHVVHQLEWNTSEVKYLFLGYAEQELE